MRVLRKGVRGSGKGTKEDDLVKINNLLLKFLDIRNE